MCTFFVGDFMNDDIYFMNAALKEAKKAYAKGEIPIGAIVVKNGKIISKGYNQRESKMMVTKHAEIVAIEKACVKLKNWRLLDCTIYITMYPCPMCASAINQARISKIVYGTVPNYVNKNIVDKILSDSKYGKPVKIVENVLSKECTYLIQNFFSEKRL